MNLSMFLLPNLGGDRYFAGLGRLTAKDVSPETAGEFLLLNANTGKEARL
jgi:hypothetical protein